MSGNEWRRPTGRSTRSVQLVATRWRPVGGMWGPVGRIRGGACRLAWRRRGGLAITSVQQRVATLADVAPVESGDLAGVIIGGRGRLATGGLVGGLVGPPAGGDAGGLVGRRRGLVRTGRWRCRGTGRRRRRGNWSATGRSTGAAADRVSSQTAGATSGGLVGATSGDWSRTGRSVMGGDVGGQVATFVGDSEEDCRWRCRGTGRRRRRGTGLRTGRSTRSGDAGGPVGRRSGTG
jgi:hypothetical protein